ncbi:uncharacterized protein LOC115670548 isoform X1 [Syzygium oleosum]|uniref:uncharacterized protein LOC115670548 isoform X1 n=1 Tax=Syzygium oleosum TaxID=219896 RepID=UPI0011D1FF65|nr:uncharacterized protein LOC115670548 isoform X1 [Syzygium oleosum]XP_056176168.1 uncharacterized protein LOC115670548 isoform X1 [Syzygium oleosum]
MEGDIECGDHGIRLQNSHPGCWFGLFHVFDYHYWRPIRRALHGKERRGRKRHGRKPCCATPKTISFSCDTSQGQDEAEHLLQERPRVEANSLNDVPASSTRELLAKDAPEEQIHQDWILSVLLRRHHRTDSILDEIKAEWKDPIIILHDGADTPIPTLQDLYSLRTGEELGAGKRAHLLERGGEVKRKLMGVGQGEKNLQQHNKDKAETERVKVNTDFLPNFPHQQDSHAGIAKQYDGQQTSIRKASFTKSRSFPVADASGVRDYPSTLKHKQSEMWSLPKGENPTMITPGPRITSSNLLQNHEIQSVQSSAMKQEVTVSSSGNSHPKNVHGWNQTVMNQIKRIKHRIRRAFKEERKENATVDARLDRISPGSSSAADTNEISEKSQYQDGENWTPVGKLHSMERTSSLHESLDRYAQLFENVYGREPNLHHSKSLKLTNEDRNSSGGNTRKYTRRRLSLPDPESLSFLLGVVSLDALCSEMREWKDGDFCVKTECDSGSKLNSSAIPSNPDRSTPSHDIPEVKFLENIKEEDREEEEEEEGDDDDAETSTELRSSTVVALDQKTVIYSDNVVESAREDNRSLHEREMSITWEAIGQVDELSSVCRPKPSPKDDEATTGEFLPSNGCIHLEEPGSLANLPSSSVLEALSASYEALNDTDTGMKNNIVNRFLKPSHLEKRDEADFSYVSHLLDLSGIFKSEQFEQWQTAEQPLNPELLDDMEDCAADHELGCSDEVVSTYSDHQLLFDLVNEALLEIFQRSSAFFPKAFSFTTNVRPIPKGQLMLEEVWKRVNRYRTRPELDQTFDDVMARDMAKGDGWLNLQWEGECVALELEDWILDDLLDEVLSP